MWIAGDSNHTGQVKWREEGAKNFDLEAATNR